MRLIDADALKTHIKELAKEIARENGTVNDFTFVLKAAYDMASEAPTIDAVPVVHARWIGGKYYNDVYGYEKTCTACGEEYVVGFDYLYCPYCGAKMDGGMKDEG